MFLLRILVFLFGVGLVARALLSAVRTFVLPRSARDGVTRTVFLTVRWFFNLRLRRANSYVDRDRVMAFYAPVGLLLLPGVWLALVLLGYMGIFWAFGVQPWPAAFTLSGSSLLTLGFALAKDWPTTVLAFSEAAIGLILVALLISYLPTMYTAFSRREAAVTMLEVRAGSPPSAVEMLARFHRLHRLSKLSELWEEWEVWFVELEETHTSLAALAFFRSPQADHSWVTAAGAVLDAAALTRSVVDTPLDRQADLCIRAGYLALRRIAEYFTIDYDPDPAPDDPISIGRDEFEAACEELASQGVPLVANREQAWRDFAGWRVNYDTVLLALAALTMAPYAPWSSDRSLRLPPS
ncbi:MAG: hypothetical protein AB1791_17725 [Chloroflexota bacterium]